MSLTGCTGRARLASVGTALLGLVYLVRLPVIAAAAGYLGVLAMAVVLVSAVVGFRLWTGGFLEARLLAVGLSAVTLAGQLLSMVMGLPGAARLAGPPGPFGTAALLIEVGIVVVLATDRECRTARRTPRPYAL
jgi:hypothetical protein